MHLFSFRKLICDMCRSYLLSVNMLMRNVMPQNVGWCKHIVVSFLCSLLGHFLDFTPTCACFHHLLLFFEMGASGIGICIFLILHSANTNLIFLEAFHSCLSCFTFLHVECYCIL